MEELFCRCKINLLLRVEGRRADGYHLLETLFWPLKHPADRLAAELEDFIAAVNLTKQTGKVCNPRIPGEEGLKALRLAVAIESEARRYNEHYGFKFSPCSPDEFE